MHRDQLPRTSAWVWPGGAAAAVSLTYDDGVASHLEHVMPDLEAAGFRGTFYPTISYEGFTRRLRRWRSAFERGHEIGNHTIHHPCRKSEGPKDLRRYSAERIESEVREAAEWLEQNIGSDPHRSFAYPCGDVAVGEPPNEDAYARAVGRCHAFARTTEDGVNSPGDVVARPLHLKSSLVDCPHCTDSVGLIRFCEEATAARGWAIFGFHGVGDRWLPTERPAHQELVDHLSAGSYWVAPLRDVARFVVDAETRGPRRDS